MNLEPNTSKEQSYRYLKLSKPLKFEAFSRARLNNVFFDEGNNQVFSVQSGDVAEVVVKCPGKPTPCIFHMKEKGPVLSMKFNPAQNILAIQRTHSCVEFMNFHDNKESEEYFQNCKSKSAKVFGFIWVSANEIIYVTDQGVELYQVESTKCAVKLIKSLAMNINWFLYCHRTSLLVLSSGIHGSTVQPLYLKHNNFHKLNRFDVSCSSVGRTQKLALEERDAVVDIVYNQPRIMILRHQTDYGAEVIIYTVTKMSAVKKTHVLRTGRSGRFAMSVVDNLIFVHHQASKTSQMFDIGLSGEFDGSVNYHSPVTQPQPIEDTESAQLYSSNWIMFPPNILIDIKIGCLWHFELSLNQMSKLIKSKSYLVEFLMLRSDSKDLILQVLRETTQDPDQDLEELALVFDKLNTVYCAHLMQSVKRQLGSPVSGSGVVGGIAGAESTASETPPRTVIEQSDMYTNVLSRLADRVHQDSPPRVRKMAIWVLLEYVRSLTDHKIPAQHFLHELAINSLVMHKAYYQLHQLLQYFVVSDSKPLACLLLSLENLYPAAHQLALDMLQRLPSAQQEIMEVLLSKHQILPALRYAIENSSEDQISGRKFLELAQGCKDQQLVHAVATYFNSRHTSSSK